MALRSPAQSFQVLPGAIIATGVGTAFRLPFTDWDSLLAQLTTTLDSGSGTLDVYLQTQDPAGNWYDMVHFVQIAAAVTVPLYARLSLEGQSYVGAVGSKTIAASAVGVPPITNNFRLAWTVSGTVSFTPTLNLIASQQDRGGI